MHNANDYVTNVSLDGTAYILRFGWTGTVWTIDVRDSNNVDIVSGIPIVANYPLLLPYARHFNTLKGQLMAVVNDGNSKIGRNCFANRAKLVYMTADEVGR